MSSQNAASISRRRGRGGFRRGGGASPLRFFERTARRHVTVDGVPTKRVSLTWADRSIVSQWLRVAVLPTTRTRVAQQDIFYFGNLIGECYFSVAYGQWRVGTVDTNATKARYGAALIDNLYDFNRDAVVDLADADISKANLNMVLAVLSAPV